MSLISAQPNTFAIIAVPELGARALPVIAWQGGDMIEGVAISEMLDPVILVSWEIVQKLKGLRAGAGMRLRPGTAKEWGLMLIAVVTEKPDLKEWDDIAKTRLTTK